MPSGADAGRRKALWFVRIALGVVVFALVFRDTPLEDLAGSFRSVDGWWLAAAVVSVMATVLIVTLRWELLLAVERARAHRLVLVSAIIASQAANIVMPLKLGDAFRIAAVSRRLQVPAAPILGSVAIERAYDAVLVGVTALLLLMVGTLPPFARAALQSLAAGIAVLLLAAATAHAAPGWTRRSAARVGRAVPARVRAAIARQIDLLATGVARASRPGLAVRAFGVSCLVMAGSIATPALLMRAFDFDLPLLAAALLVVVLQAGHVVVPVPGGIGIAQVLTAQTLAIWGIPEAQGLAFALVLYLVSRLPKILCLPFALRVLAGEPVRTL